MTYVNFIAGEVPPSNAQKTDRYRIDAIHGTSPFAGASSMLRVEGETLFEGGLCGVVQHLHYTTLVERTDLTARSRAEDRKSTRLNSSH